MEDSEDLFADYISANSDKLYNATAVDTNLLTKLVQEGVLTDHQKKTIAASSKLNYDKAEALYDILAKQEDDLPKILKVLKKTGDKQALKILENYSNSNPNVVTQGNGPASSQQAQQLVRTDAVNLSATSVLQQVPVQSVLRQIGGEIQTGGKLTLAGTSRDSKPSPLSKGLASIQNAISTVQQNYPTGAKYKGIALIVNVVNFDNEPEANRMGAQKDTEQLTQVLSQRNFLVYHLIDPTHQDLQQAIQQFQDCSFESADSFVVAIMSHGDGERIITKDNRRFEIWRNIVQQFNNINCEGLKGKPKIFVFNYCRGDVSDVGTASTHHDAMPGRINPMTIPSWTDMLVCYSTLDGHYAYRDVNEGSWFIQTLCEVLRQHGNTYDINTLLNLVSEVMKSLESEHGEKQICPYYNIGFTKKFFF